MVFPCRSGDQRSCPDPILRKAGEPDDFDVAGIGVHRGKRLVRGTHRADRGRDPRRRGVRGTPAQGAVAPEGRNAPLRPLGLADVPGRRQPRGPGTGRSRGGPPTRVALWLPARLRALSPARLRRTPLDRPRPRPGPRPGLLTPRPTGGPYPDAMKPGF